MRYSALFTAAAMVNLATAAYVPNDNYSTLTPAAPAPSGATADHTHLFGIQIVTLESTATAAPSANHKRDAVQQIGDGQVQKQTSITLSSPPAPTASVVNQIGDGQIQHQTAGVVNQIGDGQIQHQTASVVNQIGDGQIQHQTASVVNQIGDGQIQHQTASVVNQIGDGQIQHQTATSSVVNQIGDGQIQHQTTAPAASQISDGQVQNPTGTPTPNADKPTGGFPASCKTENSLGMNLSGGILKDAKGRVGAIVANRQFQFDGPPPQAGSIFAAGWSVTHDGNLALGSDDVFFQCASGDFYNLYDQNVAAQCTPVKLSVIDLVDC
ncbi:uncharacterized protein CANTADRAFT_45249 [Suhomyces tanzawaensis NRRL Y-17324]|uniref:Cell wall mannoprotein PIR1-like C-terminal domain-containing protein n=1 Tax=Suhomyces tanzawaensis NRRL Y-17324 TaxID=984487 RepID=A0A1E4SS39_9ASCO|nr:uncharacterized protein CANTADRAFT_45249 [Suhomyces tanzawaensis NRRL Y-17324]ODV82328.1 hypothetical protein CANTADRAFT_45249 [Suhomyces tanzawaensis NRRL Y-17324]